MAAFEYQPLTIYDSVRFKAGETVPQQVQFAFGADVSDDAKFELLAALPEYELTKALLSASMLCEQLFGLVGLRYPDVWALVEPLTARLYPNWNRPEPGDLDIVCGGMRNGDPAFDEINCFQVKIRKQRPGRTKGPTGRKQADATARMGFDRTVLLHMLVQEPSSCDQSQAPGWNPIRNSVFIDSIKRSMGVMRKEIESERLPYGYTLLGWGQAFGIHWQVCGGLAFEVIRAAPVRPFSSDAARRRDELRASCGAIVAQIEVQPPIVIDMSQHR